METRPGLTSADRGGRSVFPLEYALGAIAGQLQFISHHPKTVRLGADASNLGVIQTTWHIGDSPARETPCVVMRITAAAIARRPVRVVDLLGEAARHQSLEALVYGRKRYSGHVIPDRQKDLIGRGVIRRIRHVPKHGGALLREAVSPLPESSPQDQITRIRT
jgi:hypothetical protein